MRYAPILFLLLSAATIVSCSGGNSLTPGSAAGQMVLQFDGVSGMVAFPYSPVLQPKEVTIEMKVWFDTTSRQFIPLLTPDSVNLWNTASGYAVTYEDGKLYFSLASQSNVQYSIAPTLTLPTRQWVDIACTYDGHTRSIYLNGQLLKQDSYSTPIYYGPTGFTVGEALNTYYGYYPGFFHGGLAELAIWDRALTSAEISSTMSQDLTGKESGLVGYWNFDRQNSYQRTAVDRTGNGNDCTLWYGVWYGPADSL